MTTQELKITIYDLLSKTDDPDVLQGIYLLLRKLLVAEEDNIVGYEANGTPIKADEFIASVLEAEEDIKNGRIISLEELKAEFNAR